VALACDRRTVAQLLKARSQAAGSSALAKPAARWPGVAGPVSPQGPAARASRE